MAARKSSFKRITSRARRRKNPESSAAAKGDGMVDQLVDLAKPAGIAIASYGVTALSGRIAYRLGRKKSEQLGRHIGPWVSVGMALASSLAADRVDALKPYKLEISIGAMIAAAKGLLSTYLPQYGWVLQDYTLDELPAAAAPEPQSAAGARRVPTSGPARPASSNPPPSAEVDIEVDDFSDIPGMDAGFKSGIFA